MQKTARPSTATTADRLARRRGRARRARAITLAAATLIAAIAVVVVAQNVTNRGELSLHSPAALPLDI